MKTKILNLLQQHKGKKNAITVDVTVRALRVHNSGATEYPIKIETGICEYCNSWLNFIGSIPKEFSCPFCGNELEVTEIEGEYTCLKLNM